MPGPLEHLLIVDASVVAPGAIAGMLLADHGAEMIKIEPKGGSFLAHDLPRKAWDRGKKSIELDIRDEAQRAALRQLLQRADVFIHSLEAAEARELGLDRESLAAASPGLVVCALTAYGEDTPFAGRPYGESLAAAALGVMIDKSSPFRPGPVYPGHPALHYGQAFLAVIDILAALRARWENGDGQEVEATLLDAFLAQSPMNNWWNEHGISFIKKGDSAARDKYGRVRLVTGMFECADGLFLQMHTGGQGAFKIAMDLLGFGDRVQKIDGLEMAVPLNDEEYQVARVEVYEAFKSKPRDAWIPLLQAADVATLPVLEPAQVLLDDQVEFVGQRIELKDPDFGVIHQGAPCVLWGETVSVKPQPAPAVGAHNGELAALLARPVQPRRAPGPRPVRRALEGLKVLDFSSFFACGYASRLLSDLGADVIKVETPDGDQMRPLSNCFDAAQRGKRDLVLNLKSPEGMEVVRKLIAQADVVMHNLRPGKADKLGIGYAALSAINPKLIYAYLPGYGSKGPKSYLKSFAPLVSGWTGLLYEGAGAYNLPTPSVFGNEDYNNGFMGAAAVLMAVERRNQTGRGDYLECPQLHSSLFTTAEHFLDADRQVVYGMRLDKGQTGFNALDRMYPTADGRWICISCRDDARFAALARAIGRPELVSDARFATARDRSANDAALGEILGTFFQGLTVQAAFDGLDSAGAACEIVRDTNWIDDFFWEDWAERTNRVCEDKTSIYGHVRMIGLLNRLKGTPGFASGSAPRLGEHTTQILAEAGYSAEEIRGFLERKVAVEAKAPTEATRLVSAS